MERRSQARSALAAWQTTCHSFRSEVVDVENRPARYRDTMLRSGVKLGKKQGFPIYVSVQNFIRP